jgi:hypothetical protein
VWSRGINLEIGHGVYVSKSKAKETILKWVVAKINNNSSFQSAIITTEPEIIEYKKPNLN